MKKLTPVVAAPLLFGALSLSLVSSGAFAGGGGICLYGKDAGIASNAVKPGEEVIANEEMVDPHLLALLKKQQKDKAKIYPIVTFN